jgi:hypothetical protein
MSKGNQIPQGDLEIYSYDFFARQFEQAKLSAAELILSLDEVTFLTRPGPDVWCVAECFSHLINFGNLYYNTIQKGLDRNRPDGTEPRTSFPPRFYWRWITNWFEPPYKIKLKTFSVFDPEPVAGFTRQQVLADFDQLQDRLIKQLNEARDKGYDLAAVRVGNPVYPIIGMRLSECYTIVAAHQRRHFWQAEKIAERLEEG